MKLQAIRVLMFVAVALLLTSGQGFAVQLLDGEREVDVTAIPGVIDGGAEWERVWASFYTADGLVSAPGGGVVFGQEQTDRIIKLGVDNQEYTVVENTNGSGSVSVDTQGRIFAVQRTCTEPLNPELAMCNELTMVSQMFPEYRILANSFPDGTPLGRLNDLVADGRGGAYFTRGGLYYVSPDGVVSTVADQDIRTNGLALSRDGETLYVTNSTVVVAFDVASNGSTSNRRDFGTLDGDNGGDGMTVDTEGRVYVTGNAGVHVLSPDGEHLGMIPTPRRAITVAFGGPDNRTLYAPSMGAIGPDGKQYVTPDGIRNIAMTIYTIPVVSEGFVGTVVE